MPARLRCASLEASFSATEAKQLDASLLLLPEVGFLPPDDARVRGTLRAIEQRLLVDGLVMRYDTEHAQDGLPPGEGAFLACSFWLVDAYILQNRWADARALFDRLLTLRNDVGLLSEEYDQRAGRLVGNFPQAFTHVALVNSAFNLTRAEKPAQQRSQRGTGGSGVAGHCGSLSRPGSIGGCRPSCSRQLGKSAFCVRARQEPLAPRLDVVLRNHLEQRFMALAPLLERHRERVSDRRCRPPRDRTD